MVTHFKHLLLRRYLLAFATIFDSITLTREDADGVEVYRQQVPLEHGPKERWLTRLTQDPNLDRGVGQVVPRMAFELKDIQYDSTRKLSTLENLRFNSVEETKTARLYVGAPYTLHITLSILVKLQQDGMQIVEQILPFFTPDYTLAIKPIDAYDQLVDTVPVVLQSVSQTDNYEGNFETRRAIVWDLNFAMKVNFYGPVKARKRIEDVIINLYNSPYEDLSAPNANVSPSILIHSVPYPAVQNVDSQDITANTTITETYNEPEPEEED